MFPKMRGNFKTCAKCTKRWAQWLRQRQCVHIDAHFDDSFEIASIEIISKFVRMFSNDTFIPKNTH